MPGSVPVLLPRKNNERLPGSAPASVRIPSTPYLKRSSPQIIRSASPRRIRRPVNSSHPRSAPGRFRYTPEKLQKKSKEYPKKKGPGRFMRGLVMGLALLSGASLTHAPRNQVRMGGQVSRPQETRIMPYTGHRHMVFAAPGVYNVPSFPVQVINDPSTRYKAVIGSIERKLMPGRVIGKNAAKAKPVYLRNGKAGPVLVGFKPGITPEQARFLLSRGYKFSTRNLQNNVMHARLIDPNMSAINRQTQMMLMRAQLTGKTGINAYSNSLRNRIRGLAKTNVGFGAIVPQGAPKALPK